MGKPTPHYTIPVQEVITMYSIQHIPFYKIARRFHVDSSAIRKILTDNNITIHRPSNLVNLTHEILNQLYIVEELPSTEIAKRFNITNPTVLNRLREFGIIVRPAHGNPCAKNYITDKNKHHCIQEIRIIGGKNKRMGVTKCPICHQTRLITLHGKNDKDFTGVCRKCAMAKHRIHLDVEEIINLYTKERLTSNTIAKRFHVSSHKIIHLLKDNDISIRSKQESHNKVIRNKGTIDNHVLGDICRGIDIGLNDPSYYLWVECPRCHAQRWQVKSHVKRSPMCRDCAMDEFGINHSGENAQAWLGGISFEPYSPEFNRRLKEVIRQRDYYTCQVCGSKNEKFYAVHHIDYDKKNCKPENLISLCHNCHSKTNHRRKYWQPYLHSLLIARGIIPPDEQKPKKVNKLQLAFA